MTRTGYTPCVISASPVGFRDEIDGSIERTVFFRDVRLGTDNRIQLPEGVFDVIDTVGETYATSDSGASSRRQLIGRD